MTGPVDNRPDPVSSPLSRGRKTDGQCSESPGPPWPEPAECRTARLLADLKYRPRRRLRTTPPALHCPHPALTVALEAQTTKEGACAHSGGSGNERQIDLSIFKLFQQRFPYSVASPT